MGRRAQVAAVLGVCCLVLVAGWWGRVRCIPDAWGTAELYAQWCYTDIYPLYYAHGLDAGAIPYVEAPVEYPVLTGAQMAAAAPLARALPGDEGRRFYDLTAAWNGMLLAAVLAALLLAGVPRTRLWAFAAAPTLGAAAFLNWDAAAVALAVMALLAHRGERDVLAGVAAGLGAAAKLFPALLVPVFALTRWRQGRTRDALAHVGVAAATWLVVNVPVAVVAPEGWWEFFRLSRERPPDWDSLWFVAAWAADLTLPVTVVNAASAALFLAGAGAVLLIGSRRLPPTDTWRLSVPVLAWFLLTSKVYSPQFSLWLLPLLVLAWPGAGSVLTFLVADLAVFAVRFPFLAGPAGHEPIVDYGWLAAAIVLRAAALLWLVVSSTRGPGSERWRVPG